MNTRLVNSTSLPLHLPRKLLFPLVASIRTFQRDRPLPPATPVQSLELLGIHEDALHLGAEVLLVRVAVARSDPEPDDPPADAGCQEGLDARDDGPGEAGKEVLAASGDEAVDGAVLVEGCEFGFPGVEDVQGVFCAYFSVWLALLLGNECKDALVEADVKVRLEGEDVMLVVQAVGSSAVKAHAVLVKPLLLFFWNQVCPRECVAGVCHGAAFGVEAE